MNKLVKRVCRWIVRNGQADFKFHVGGLITDATARETGAKIAAAVRRVPPVLRKPNGGPDLGAIQEMSIQCKGGVKFVYFAWLDGKWTDLAPFGNRLP